MRPDTPSGSRVATRARPRSRASKAPDWLLPALIMALAAALIGIAISRFTAAPADIDALELPPPARAAAVAGATAGPNHERRPELRRIGLYESATAAVDGIDTGLDVDIAIIDTGIDADHPDLNVAGGASCTGQASFDDTDGHGTAVAGLAAARDNGMGTVGVAPGARLWAVRVGARPENVPDPRLVCGLDWVAAHADTIDVAIVSFGGYVRELAETCDDGGHVGDVRAALCRVDAAGVTIVASAGNDSRDAARYEPAAYDEVLAVSALNDADGRAGGLAGTLRCAGSEHDDTFASYSNFGTIVDLTAPGTCLRASAPGGGTTTVSGTSFSTPLVGGAAALVRTRDPGATPDQVATRLRTTARGETLRGDPDGTHEPVLNVARL